MTIGDDSVKANLVQVRSLELEHLVDTSSVNSVCSIGDLLGRAIDTTETGRDELLAKLVKKVKGRKVSAGGNLDQLCKSVTDLTLWESAKEAEIEKRLHWGVVGTKTVLVVAVVDSNLDGDRGINQTNHGGWDSDVVGVAAVGCTSKSVSMLVLFMKKELTTWAWARVP